MVHPYVQCVQRVIRMGGVAAGALVALSAVASAQRPVVWSVEVSHPSPVAAGAVVTLELKARIDTGWHMYALSQEPGGPVRTQISVAPRERFTLADSVRAPAPAKRFDPNFGIDVDTYDQHVTFVVPVRVATGAPAGRDTVVVSARFQTCNASLCLPPHTEKLMVPITVASGPARPTRSGT